MNSIIEYIRSVSLSRISDFCKKFLHYSTASSEDIGKLNIAILVLPRRPERFVAFRGAIVQVNHPWNLARHTSITAAVEYGQDRSNVTERTGCTQNIG